MSVNWTDDPAKTRGEDPWETSTIADIAQMASNSEKDCDRCQNQFRFGCKCCRVILTFEQVVVVIALSLIIYAAVCTAIAVAYYWIYAFGAGIAVLTLIMLLFSYCCNNHILASIALALGILCSMYSVMMSVVGLWMGVSQECVLNIKWQSQLDLTNNQCHAFGWFTFAWFLVVLGFQIWQNYLLYKIYERTPRAFDLEKIQRKLHRLNTDGKLECYRQNTNGDLELIERQLVV
jgi:hypothetical protein